MIGKLPLASFISCTYSELLTLSCDVLYTVLCLNEVSEEEMSVSLEKTNQTSKQTSPSPFSTEIYDLQRGNTLLILPMACHGILVIYFLDILTNFILHLSNL